MSLRTRRRLFILAFLVVAFIVGAILLVMFREEGLLAVLLIYLAVGMGRALYQFAMAVWDADPQTNTDS